MEVEKACKVDLRTSSLYQSRLGKNRRVLREPVLFVQQHEQFLIPDLLQSISCLQKAVINRTYHLPCTNYSEAFDIGGSCQGMTAAEAASLNTSIAHKWSKHGRLSYSKDCDDPLSIYIFPLLIYS